MTPKEKEIVSSLPPPVRQFFEEQYRLLDDLIRGIPRFHGYCVSHDHETFFMAGMAVMIKFRFDEHEVIKAEAQMANAGIDVQTARTVGLAQAMADFRRKKGAHPRTRFEDPGSLTPAAIMIFGKRWGNGPGQHPMFDHIKNLYDDLIETTKMPALCAFCDAQLPDGFMPKAFAALVEVLHDKTMQSMISAGPLCDRCESLSDKKMRLRLSAWGRKQAPEGCGTSREFDRIEDLLEVINSDGARL